MILFSLFWFYNWKMTFITSGGFPTVWIAKGGRANDNQVDFGFEFAIRWEHWSELFVRSIKKGVVTDSECTVVQPAELQLKCFGNNDDSRYPVRIISEKCWSSFLPTTQTSETKRHNI